MKNLSNLIIELILALTLGAVYWHGPMPLNPDPFSSLPRAAHRLQMSLPAGTELNLRTAIAANWPTTGFVADPAYPEVDASNLWSKWLYFYLYGNFPYETRFCGIDLPDFSRDLGLALEAADLLNIEPSNPDDPVAICNELILPPSERP